MGYNFKKMFLKRSTTFLLVLSFTSSALYLPAFAPRAHAIFGIADFGFTIDVKALAREIADGIAMVAAQKMVDSMVNSTVEWAQSGFDGNPAYVTDQKQYFADLSDGIAGDYIANNEKLNFLCSPFQVQVRIALQQSYTGQNNYFQCTLTDVVANIDAFYNDFSQGGWDGWFAMTQNGSNNPYGAYIEASLEMNSRLASAVGLKKEQLQINTGFLNTEKC